MVDNGARDGDNYSNYEVIVEGRLIQLRHLPCGQTIHTWMISFPPNIGELASWAQRHTCP